jgi:hypothetical protein
VGVELRAVGGHAGLFEQVHHRLPLLFDQVLRLFEHCYPDILLSGLGLQYTIEEGARLI